MTLPELDPALPLRLPAPAKINLFLHIVGRRPDGYHLLQTAFRLLDWGDEIILARRDDGAIVRTTDVPGVPPESDLVVRAARALQVATGSPFGADIGVLKRIPMGGGLGGGSSDAATVLLALNHLWQLGLPRKRLQDIGLALGADVPFFIFGANAFAEGVGEHLHAVDLPPAWYVVLEPPVQVPTAAIFSAPELRRDTPSIHPAAWRPGFGGNDLEAVAASRYPAVAEHLRWLSNFGQARMSGSGACVFSAFERQEEALSVIARMPAGMRGWVAPGLDDHPLRGLCT